MAKHANFWKSGPQNRPDGGGRQQRKFLKLGIHDRLIKLQHQKIVRQNRQMSGRLQHPNVHQP